MISGGAPHSRDPESGLALVEMLVALALLALMTALLLGAWQTGRVMLDASERRLKEPSLEAAERLLRDLIQGAQAIQPVRLEAEEQRQPVLRGAPDRVTLTALIEKLGYYAGLYRVAVSLAPERSSRTVNTLVADLVLHRPSTAQSGAAMGNDAGRERVTILRGVEAVTFRHFGIAEDDDQSRWHTTWTHRQHLPNLISVSVALSGRARGERALAIEVPAAPIGSPGYGPSGTKP